MVTVQLCSWLEVQRCGYHNTINTARKSNNLGQAHYEDPPVHAGDEKHTYIQVGLGPRVGRI